MFELYNVLRVVRQYGWVNKMPK